VASVRGNKSSYVEFAVVDVIPVDLAEPAMRLDVRRTVLEIIKYYSRSATKKCNFHAPEKDLTLHVIGTSVRVNFRGQGETPPMYYPQCITIGKFHTFFPRDVHRSILHCIVRKFVYLQK